jgi:hypothetical protein
LAIIEDLRPLPEKPGEERGKLATILRRTPDDVNKCCYSQLPRE